MSTDTATPRAAAFFVEIAGMVPFADHGEVSVHTRGLAGETPLKVAVVRQDVQLVKELVELGADPNLPGEDDYTPFHHAVRGGSTEIVRLLLAHGASASCANRYGATPFDYATDQNRPLLTRKA